jgi:hypothetical protein
MANPIHILLDHFFPALEKIAPEKATEIEKVLAQNQLKFEIEDTEEPFFFFASPSDKKITAGVGALGRLWATAYGYFCLYTTVADVAKKDIHTAHELDLKGGERIDKASTLLEWTIHVENEIAELKKKKTPLPPSFDWPSGLPQPIPNPPHASDSHVADELFLCAGAFILHHELAHIRLGHKPSYSSSKMKQLEEEADMAAAHWMLDGLDQGDMKFVKRALGVALALSWLASVAVYVPEDQDDHPPSCDRLYRVISHFVTDPNHVVWAFVSTILRANMEARKMDYDKQREAKSFKDDVEYCISVFKNYQAK